MPGTFEKEFARWASREQFLLFTCPAFLTPFGLLLVRISSAQAYRLELISFSG